MKLILSKTKIFLALAMAVVLMPTLVGCSGQSLEKEVKQTLLKGDTTEARFAELCEFVERSGERSLLDANGEADVALLGEYINGVGARLRPARQWNVGAYGIKQLLLSVYLERSGSMTPYDTQGGGGELKKAVNDLINFFPSDGAEPSIFIVNDGVYAYDGQVTEFLKDKNIYASTANVGNASHTDFGEIFSTILEKQQPNEVSVLITDMIYSPKNTKNVSAEKIFNEENSLATSVFKQYPEKSVLVSKLSGTYQGKYYPYNQTSFVYNGSRPFYIFVIADKKVVDKMTSDAAYGRFVNVANAEHFYRFNQPEMPVDVSILPNWEGSKGRYRIAREEGLMVEKCEGDRVTGMLQFSIAANLSVLDKDEDFLCDASNYEVASAGGYQVSVAPIAASQVSGNNKSYLEGKTHIITISGMPEVRKDEVVIKIKNDFPQWICQSNATDDTDAGAAGFENTTFGIEPFLKGIYDAYVNVGDAYATIRIKIEK